MVCAAGAGPACFDDVFVLFFFILAFTWGGSASGFRRGGPIYAYILVVMFIASCGTMEKVVGGERAILPHAYARRLLAREG
jgi:hypothetical protein